MSLALGGVIHQAPPASASVSTNSQLYQDGDTVNISGDQMAGGETVTVDLYYPDATLTQEHQVTAAGDGTFTDSYVIPLNAPGGI